MKEITITFTSEELTELARQLYMASYVITGFPYHKEKLARKIMNKVCAAGFAEAPETGAFRHGGFTETKFTISLEAGTEGDAVIEQFKDDAVAHQLPFQLADRDFEEKYGKMDPMDIVQNAPLLAELKTIQEKYKLDFERYGVLYLRMEEQK